MPFTGLQLARPNFTASDPHRIATYATKVCRACVREHELLDELNLQ